MSSEGQSQKSKSSLPHYLLNGTSHQHASVSSKERQKLIASIESSSNDRKAIDLEAPQLQPQIGGDDSHLNKIIPAGRPKVPSRLSEKPRDPRDEKEQAHTPSTSRPASPYTLNPPIDFDGLSWPSKPLT